MRGRSLDKIMFFEHFSRTPQKKMMIKLSNFLKDKNDYYFILT